MNALVLVEFVLLVALLSSSVLGIRTDGLFLSDRDPKPRKCVYSLEKKMLTASCGELYLKELPKSLRTDIEILDFSGNLLRDLTNDTLSPYKSLIYLYLAENFIGTVAEGAFSRLTNLELINLNTNGIDEFPKSLLNLPKLRTIQLAKNKISDSSISPTSQAEDAALEYLDLTDNKLSSLPHFGVLPKLKYLNVSKNNIRHLKTDDVGILCSLEILDISKNPIDIDDCSCIEFIEWISLRKIKLFPEKFKCTIDPIKCPIYHQFGHITNDTFALYDSCKYVMSTKEAAAKARSTWILVATTLSVFLTILFITLYCIHKRNRRRREKKINNLKKDNLTINHANAELLNEKHNGTLEEA